METKIAGCPLGAKCEEVKTENGKQVMYVCPWFTTVRGVDNNTGLEIDRKECAIALLPALLINTANESRKGVAATESFRNEVSRRADSDATAVVRTLQSLAPSIPLLIGN